MKKSRWIDISVPLRDGMVHWPDNPPVRIERILDLDRGDLATVSKISMGSHTGTHMDAPLHFVQKGAGMDQMPIDATVGLARVIEIRDRKSIRLKELQHYHIRSGERILFKTKNSGRCWKSDKFVKEFVYLSTEAAIELARIKVRTVGIDYLSIGGYKQNGLEVHRTLLSQGIWVIEGLDLSKVEPGFYDLICLPLKMAQGDGAPARAILKKLGGTR
ncbi:MAG: cyclase family protein [Elusimicrobia bacterium]|nr:cyclase family protein [Elusimicrobiota bacterium]